MLKQTVLASLICVFLLNTILYLGCANPAQLTGQAEQSIATQQEAREHLIKGTNYFTQKLWDQSIAEFTTAIELYPKLAIAYNNRGSTYGEKGDYDRAIADYTRAIEIDPNFAEAYRNRGIAYGKKGDYDSAIADLTIGITLDPKDTLSYYNRAIAYDKKGEKANAEADFKKAKELGLK
jgi:tetratricopeptide (TPR) repeat protein